MEQTEETRHTLGMKERYQKRKETIERIFADAKEKHGMRYTQYRGLAKIRMELNLLFGCMNLKKMAIWKWRIKWSGKYRSFIFQKGQLDFKKIIKDEKRFGEWLSPNRFVYSLTAFLHRMPFF